MLKKINISQKLYLVLLIPMFGGALLFSITVLDRMRLYNEMTQMEELTEFSLMIEDVAHETQKERGLTAGFIGSNGQSFISEISAQRALTDKKVASFILWLKSFKATNFNQNVQNELASLLLIFEKIYEHRKKVDELSISFEGGVDFYTQLNSKMFGVIHIISKLGTHSEITPILSGFVHFLESKERVGLERAMLTKVFSQGYYENDLLKEHLRNISEQEIYLNLFLKDVSKELIEVYKDKTNDFSFQQVEVMRNIALSKKAGKNFNIKPLVWFNTMTNKLNLLKEVEMEVASELKTKAIKIKDETINFSLKILFGSIFLFLVMLLLVLVIINHLKKNIAILNGAAHKIAIGNFDAQVEVESRDELGMLASAFNKMTSAIRETTEEIKSSEKEYQSLSEKYKVQNEELLDVNNSLFYKEKLLRKGQKIAKLGNWSLNHKTGEMIWSNEIYRIFGVKRGVIKASYEKVMQLIHPDDREKVDIEFKKSIAQGERFHITHRIVLEDGTIRIIDEHGETSYDKEGVPNKSIGVLQDVTELKSKEFRLENSIAEKNILLKEVHHRVKNNLQIISALLSLRETENPEVKAFVKESNARIKSMALLHEKIYQVENVDKFGFKDYVDCLLGELIQSFGFESCPVSYQIEIDDHIELRIKDAINLGLIITEIVTNSLKYAFEGMDKGEIEVSFLSRENGEVCLVVRDNGKGIDSDSFDKKTTGSLIVRSLARQLGGELVLENSNGAVYTLVFRSK